MDADAVENVGWDTGWMVLARFVSTVTWLARHSLVMISVFPLEEEVALVGKNLSNETSPFQSGEVEWAISGIRGLSLQVIEGGPGARFVLKYDQSPSCRTPSLEQLTRRYTPSFATASATVERGRPILLHNVGQKWGITFKPATCST